MTHATLEPGFDDMRYGTNNPLTSDRTCPEQELWCAVLTQALIDANIIQYAAERYKRNTDDQKQVQHQAIRFIKKDKKDFYFVCDLAGINPYVIRKAVEKRTDRT